MQLDEVVLDPIGAQRVLEGGLDAEDQVLLRLAQVEEAPVEALVEARVRGDRGLGDGRGDDGEARELDLDAAELDPLVVLEFTGDGDEAALGERGDRGSRLVGDDGTVGIRRAGVHELHRTRLVAQYDELHLLLVAHGLDPAGDAHRPVGGGCEVLDQGAFSHGPRV